MHLSDTQLRNFGLTMEEGDLLLAECGERCPACGKPFSRGRLPHVDHSHWSGMIRGLLCGTCNTEIGLKHDNGGWFARVASYLHHPPATRALGRAAYMPGSPGNPREDYP